VSHDSELDQNLSGDLRKKFSSDLNDIWTIWYVGRGRWVMHDGMPYGRSQGQGHSSEVDRQSPTGLIFFLNQEVNQKTVRCICSVWIMYSILLTGLTTRRWVRSVGGIQSELAKLGVTRRHALSRGSPRRMQYVPGPVTAAKCYLSVLRRTGQNRGQLSLTNRATHSCNYYYYYCTVVDALSVIQ